MWKTQYPDGQRRHHRRQPANMTEDERKSIGRLVLPVNRPVQDHADSEDVIHDFGVPRSAARSTCCPAGTRRTWYHPTKIGEYHIFCDQYCGTWHSLMVGKIAVVAEQEYDDVAAGHKLASRARATRSTGRWRGGAAAVPEAPVHQLPHAERADAPGTRRWKGCYGKQRAALKGGGGGDRRRGVHPRVDPQPAGEGRRGLGADHAGHYDGPGDGRGAERPGRVHQEPEARADARSGPSGSRPRSGRRTPTPAAADVAVGGEEADEHHDHPYDTPSRAAAAARAGAGRAELPEQRLRHLVVAVHRRPQADRHPVPGVDHRLLPGRRDRRRAGPAQPDLADRGDPRPRTSTTGRSPPTAS